ncbi:hypothetical protein P3X46_004866 [Hevea brasiliensis]|uniref:CCHC-type domain-containing protein n=1 Tax=Hevea brasiliensis TaxID=3981 RepID=A0ABQ9MYW3_HEVBR|nr:hypothetical protein P3X46_004866 [Hevea brasiliensis]
MQGLKWSARLISTPPKNEGIGALPTNPIIREKANRGRKGESSRCPRRSFKVSKETVQAPRISRELKVVEFEQLRQTTNMSVNKYIDKFINLLQYKANRYTQRLHSRYSSLILATESHSFYSIVDAIRKMEAISSFGTKKDKGGKFSKKQKKNKFKNRIKSGLRMGGRSSLGLDTSNCVRCGEPHQGVYRFGTSQYYKCGQEGHMSRECPSMERVASQ